MTERDKDRQTEADRERETETERERPPPTDVKSHRSEVVPRRLKDSPACFSLCACTHCRLTTPGPSGGREFTGRKRF